MVTPRAQLLTIAPISLVAIEGCPALFGSLYAPIQLHHFLVRLKTTSPLRNQYGFWHILTPSGTMLMVGLVLSSTPLLTFTGLALLTTTGSSATSHQHKSWITP